jgi:site-specific DNA-methyltransferase (adenine-specific)
MTVELIQGDCLQVLKTIPSGSVDAVITDPPYGVGLVYGGYADTENNYKDLCTSFMPEAIRIAANFVAVTPGMKHLNWWYVTYPPAWTMAWIKPNQCSSSPMGGFNAWEPVLIYGKTRIRQDAFTMPISTRQKGVGNHPCPKDLGSWIKLIHLLDGNDNLTSILDPFMGSGTTGVACVQTGRNFIGIEIDPGYFAIAQKRIAEAQLQVRMQI